MGPHRWHYTSSKIEPLAFQQADTTGCSAIAAYVTTDQDAAWTERVGVPALNVSGLHELDRLPRVTVDQHSVGSLAAEHFLLRGYHHFAAIGYDHVALSQQRISGFRHRLQRAQRPVQHFAIPAQDRHGHHGLGLQPRSISKIAHWLEQLPPETAIFAINDALAVAVAQAAVTIRRRIPQDVAILGTDNTPIAAAASPQLSSIVLPQAVLGRRCGSMLAAALQGAALVHSSVAAMDIEARASTSHFATEAPLLGALHDLLQSYNPSISESAPSPLPASPPSWVYHRVICHDDCARLPITPWCAFYAAAVYVRPANGWPVAR